jgi:pimeloyl-ACP methyl ester carboxylesterase
MKPEPSPTTQENNVPVTYFQHNKMVLAYTVHGHGKRVLLAFHGFGQNKNYWKTVAEALPAHEFTVYSFDLFFHGGSVWPHRDSPISKETLCDFFTVFFQHQQITKFSAAGFSLGGKFALCLAENFTKQIEELWLVAPDGLNANFWYGLATGYTWSRALFKRFIFKPKLFFQLVNVLHSLRLADRSVLRFAANQMSTRAKRSQVYFSWCVFKDLRVDVNALAKSLNTHQVKVLGVSGKYDKVIHTDYLSRFCKKVKSSELVVLEAGHANLLQKLGAYLATKQ